MIDNEKSLIQSFYESHHEDGQRLKQSFLENRRGLLFAEWIGINKKVLDLGGRDGTLTKHFIEKNNVTLADIDENALEYAKRNYKVETMKVDLNQSLPFKDNSFDVVVMAEVLEHLPYPNITLSEIKRVLKTNGRFIGNLPLAYHLKDRWQIIRGRKLLISGDPTHLQFFSFDDVQKLISNFFNIEEIVILKGGKLSKKFPNDNFIILMGEDNYKNIRSWKESGYIINNYKILVYPRESSSIKENFISGKLYNISSSMIRNRIAKSEDISELVPFDVIKEIERKGFYSR